MMDGRVQKFAAPATFRLESNTEGYFENVRAALSVQKETLMTIHARSIKQLQYLNNYPRCSDLGTISGRGGAKQKFEGASPKISSCPVDVPPRPSNPRTEAQDRVDILQARLKALQDCNMDEYSNLVQRSPPPMSRNLGAVDGSGIGGAGSNAFRLHSTPSSPQGNLDVLMPSPLSTIRGPSHSVRSFEEVETKIESMMTI